MVVRVLPDGEGPTTGGEGPKPARDGEGSGFEELARLCALLLDQDESP